MYLCSMQQKAVGPWPGGISLLKFQKYVNLFLQQYATGLTLWERERKKTNRKKRKPQHDQKQMGLVGAGHLSKSVQRLCSLTKLDLTIQIPLRSWVKKRRNPATAQQATARAAPLAHKPAPAIVLLDSFWGRAGWAGRNFYAYMHTQKNYFFIYAKSKHTRTINYLLDKRWEFISF